MKIQCDVCDKDEASVFCVADEAALCAACDHRVHHANKLAGKHQRFSLHHPPPKQSPLCDICQERRAFLFCQQDRAILCKDCDISIHKANEHTQKHTRFLLTGVKLSSHSALYSSSSNSSGEPASSDAPDDVPNIPLMVSPTNPPSTSQSCDKINTDREMINGGDLNDGPVSGSSISEYLIDMLPGWHVEDLLDSSSYGFCKSGENELLPFWDGDVEQQSNMIGLTTEKMGLWVPQVHPPLNQIQNGSYQSVDLAFGAPIGMKDQCKEFSTNNNMKHSGKIHTVSSSTESVKQSITRKRIDDCSFLVPNITPLLNAPKKSRTFW